jgi:uncharacterized membrane protein YgcG
MNLNRLLKNSLGTAMLAAALALAPQAAQARVFISVGIAPPIIPVYTQPLCPGDGYIWTPGYWAYGDQGYYWVDGAWVLAPYEGALWTPGYWGWGGGVYFWNPGYWGRHVGFYGGINYGFGYFGTGFYGGYWNGGHFFYNRAYGNFGAGFHGNFYSRPVAGLSNTRPGGASFTHTSNTFAANHGAGINGHVNIDHGVRTTSSNPGFNDRTTSTANHGFAQSGAQTHATASAPRSFASAGSAPHASAPAPHAATGGGGHPSTGGGGHPSGGGGGGGHSGGGGGHR